jgi:hypothetical protein
MTTRARLTSVGPSAVVVLVGAVLVCGCGEGSPPAVQPQRLAATTTPVPAPTPTPPAQQQPPRPATPPAHSASIHRRVGAGHTKRAPHTGGQSPGGTSATSGTTGFGVTVAFVHCMRRHGVNFPYPKPNQPLFTPGRGIDPGSPKFQAAVNGPCRSLAPPAWVSSGPSSGAGGP